MRVAFYARVSTEEQAEKGSVESQVEFAGRYFDLHGPALGLEGYEIYKDEGVSGSIALEKRPAAARLLQDAAAGKFQAVYVYRLDRLARSTLHVLSAYEFLDSYNIALASMTEMFDTGTSSGKFFMTMLASIAALERDTIMERTLLGKEKAAGEGRWSCGRPPYGYRVGPGGRLQLYEPEAKVVREIFRLYLEGMKTSAIASYLNACNVLTPLQSKKGKSAAAGSWGPAQVSMILRNRVYTGKYRTMQRSRRQKEGVHIPAPVIIEEHDFARANRLLLQNSDAARGERSKRTYALRGLIYCGVCGRKMVGNTGSGRKGRVYYRCSRRNNGGSCSNKQVPAGPLEKAVWEDIAYYITELGEHPQLLQHGIPRSGPEPGPLREELAEIDNLIKEKQSARRRVIALAGRGAASAEEAENELKALEKEMETLHARREKLLAGLEKSRAGQEGRDIPALLRKNRDFIYSTGPIPEVINLLVERVDIYTETRSGTRCSRARVRYRLAENGPELGNSRDVKV